MSDSNFPNQTDQKDNAPETVNSSDSGAGGSTTDETSADSQETISMDTVADITTGGKDLPLDDLDGRKSE